MTTVVLLVAVWVVLGLVPLGWWLRSRRQVDVWRALPVPAALIRRDGSVRAATGPAPAEGFRFEAALDGLPARGRVVRLRGRDGTPVAATGVRGGALVLALPVDPLRERRDRLLADLGSRLAHDVNTPLAALMGHLDLVSKEPMTLRAFESIETCQRELTRLQTITSDLLALTRLRANPGVRSVCLAGALAEDAAGAYLQRADELGVELTVEVPAARVAVQVAEADLVRALRNLVANALVHGLPDGPYRSPPDVVVSVDARPQEVVFAVADRGPGIAPAELAGLCDPLVRGRSRAEGSGLGLAIVAEVLAGHGAELSCAPRSGGGAVLSFVLPRSL